MSKERAELDKHRLDVMKAGQVETVKSSHEYALQLQALIDELFEQFYSAKTSKERSDAAHSIVRVMSELNRMLGYYATAKNEVSLDVVPQENTIGRYFEMIDERLKEERARELNGALD